LRIDGREASELREVTITRNYTRYAEGSVLVRFGDTWVVTTASIEDKVPQFIKSAGRGRGWVTAEYAMLPRATRDRRPRETGPTGRAGGRSLEIQRLVGRTLRAVVDLDALGERTIWVDCDVLQADGGTRTAAITGAFVALVDACLKLKRTSAVSVFPVIDFVAGVSVGLVLAEPALDLCYEEDSRAAVDMSVVMTGQGRFVEIQGTAEHGSFGDADLGRLLDLARTGCARLIAIQRASLGPDGEAIRGYAGVAGSNGPDISSGSGSRP
jgi:ribonuclease PH